MTNRQALRRIRALSRAGRYLLTDYCVLRMVARDVMPEDVEASLCGAERVWSQPNGRWRVAGPDVDGEPLVLIVEILSNVVVVTLFRGDENEPDDE